jgi:endonuclease YncB( thermonuclease family)
MRSFLILAFFLVSLASHAEQHRNCVVVGVADGDTITARCGDRSTYEQLRVRLHAIDAPEKRQAYGMRAKQALSRLVFGKQATLDCIDIDRYGRSVCKVMVAPASAADGRKTLDAGLAMLTLGMAWWYRSYAREQSPQEQGQYEFAEGEARARLAGLWRDPEPIEPWAWRRTEHGA